MSKVTGGVSRGKGRAKRKVGFRGTLKVKEWAEFKRKLRVLTKRYKDLKVVFG